MCSAVSDRRFLRVWRQVQMSTRKLLNVTKRGKVAETAMEPTSGDMREASRDPEERAMRTDIALHNALALHTLALHTCTCFAYVHMLRTHVLPSLQHDRHEIWTCESSIRGPGKPSGLGRENRHVQG